MKILVAGLAIALLPAALVSAQTPPPAKAKTEAKTMRLYKGQNFTGQSYEVIGARSALMMEMNIGSIAVFPGEKWEVCDKPRFKGTCTIVESDTSNMGAAAIQSARPVKAPKTK